MAIDRTKAYYKTWVNDVGWNMRFEIIPAGESVDAGANIDAVTYVPLERGMVTVKSQKCSFDKIPFGVGMLRRWRWNLILPTCKRT